VVQGTSTEGLHVVDGAAAVQSLAVQHSQVMLEIHHAKLVPLHVKL
jgi:hypothetical protein